MFMSSQTESILNNYIQLSPSGEPVAADVPVEYCCGRFKIREIQNLIPEGYKVLNGNRQKSWYSR